MTEGKKIPTRERRGQCTKRSQVEELETRTGIVTTADGGSGREGKLLGGLPFELEGKRGEGLERRTVGERYKGPDSKSQKGNL